MVYLLFFYDMGMTMANAALCIVFAALFLSLIHICWTKGVSAGASGIADALSLESRVFGLDSAAFERQRRGMRPWAPSLACPACGLPFFAAAVVYNSWLLA